MSEPIPESIPTSSDPRSHRPTKRRALTPVSQQASAVTALFADPTREINLPPSSTDLSKKRTLAAPPEIVANVQGSSAGAGSGEFHVYKASRRREYERLRAMDEEVKTEKEDEAFRRKREEEAERDRKKTEKNREKREKAKARKKGKGKGDGNDSLHASGSGVKDKLNEAKILAFPATGKDGEQREHHESGPLAEEEKGVTIVDED